jgi:hypothetical protein
LDSSTDFYQEVVMFGKRVRPDAPSHIKGVPRGEERVQRKGPEPGRETGARRARDSTSINPESRDPIDPRMPYMPPA